MKVECIKGTQALEINSESAPSKTYCNVGAKTSNAVTKLLQFSRKGPPYFAMGHGSLNLLWVVLGKMKFEQDLKASCRKLLGQFWVDIENNERCGSSWYDFSQVAMVWKLSPPSQKYQIIVRMTRSIPVKKLMILGHSENLLTDDLVFVFHSS